MAKSVYVVAKPVHEFARVPSLDKIEDRLIIALR